MSNYYDGSYTSPTQHGPTIVYDDPVIGARFYRQTFHQLAANYSPAAIDSSGPESGSYVYEETEPKSIGGGLVEWDRLSCAVPASRTEPEGYIYTRQQISMLIVPATGEVQRTLVEFPVPTTSLVTYSYVRASDPASITIKKAFRNIQIGNSILSVGSTLNDTLTHILAEDSEITRFKGKIWQVKDRFVARQDIELNEED